MNLFVNWLNGFSVQETLLLVIFLFTVGLLSVSATGFYAIKFTGKFMYHIARMIYIYHLFRKNELHRQ